MEIKILHKQGKSIRQIAKITGRARNTVRGYLRGKATEYEKRPSKPSILDPHKPYIVERIKQCPKIPNTVLLDEIKNKGYPGGITTIRNFVRPLKLPETPDVVRFETPPGKQMQVDWTHMGKIAAFVAVLGYSRRAFVHFVTDLTVDSLIICHQLAFEFFGGIPEEILYDNMKSVVLQRDRYGKGAHQFQPAFYDFAHHCGFIPRLCKPYRPQTKGKVERFNQYLKRSFYYPLISQREIDIHQLNFEVKKWLIGIADQRRLRAQGSSPAKLFELEQGSLLPLPPTYSLVELPPIHVEQHPLHLYAQLGGYA